MAGTLMPSEDNKIFAALGSLQTQVSSLADKVDNFHAASTEEHRKVHDIVDATSEAVRNIARDVAEMKPHVESYKHKAESIDGAVNLAHDYREERAERRGADKLKKWLYGLWASLGALLVFLLGKIWDALTIRPHP